jgi:hypothetical protein
MNPEWFDAMRPIKILDSEGNKFQNQGNMFLECVNPLLTSKIILTFH